VEGSIISAVSQGRPDITLNQPGALARWSSGTTAACSTADCWSAIKIINSGLVDLSDIVSQRFPLTDALRAFAAAEDGKSLKVVLEP
jgi:threonine dehydrogenase-like Zn-dependent dehydrogenase